MVKIAVSSIAPGGLDSLVDHRFGRCDYFTIVDVENDKINNITILQNPAVNQSSGAAILAAQTIANQGCTAVVTGKLTPNAYDALTRLNIKPYMAPIGQTVKEVIEDYIKNQLIPFTPPTTFNRSSMPPGPPPPPKRIISRRRGTPRLHY